MAVTAATLTSVAVFFPMVFITGIAGQLFRDQSLTVSFALALLAGRRADAGADAGGRARADACGRRDRRRRRPGRARRGSTRALCAHGGVGARRGSSAGSRAAARSC